MLSLMKIKKRMYATSNTNILKAYRKAFEHASDMCMMMIAINIAIVTICVAIKILKDGYYSDIGVTPIIMACGGVVSAMDFVLSLIFYHYQRTAERCIDEIREQRVRKSNRNETKQDYIRIYKETSNG